MAEKNIKCPHCNSELTLDEELMGVEVTCPVCNQNFVAESGIEQNSMDENAETVENEENNDGFAAKAKKKFATLYSDAKQKMDEAQNEENKRFEESNQVELFNKVRQGGIYRKIWNISLYK